MYAVMKWGWSTQVLMRAVLLFLYYHYYYCIDRCIYLNLSDSTQSTAGLKALKPAANRRYYVQIITLLFPFTVQKCICPLVSKVHAGSFHVSVIHQTPTWTKGS